MSKLIGKMLLWLLGHVLQDTVIFHLDLGLRTSANGIVAALEQQHEGRSGELKRDKAYKALYRMYPDMPKRQLSLAIEWGVQRLKGIVVS